MVIVVQVVVVVMVVVVPCFTLVTIPSIPSLVMLYNTALVAGFTNRAVASRCEPLIAVDSR